MKYKLVELDISQLYIDESKNKIYAHIKDNEAIKEIEEYLKNNNFDISIMEYIIDETESIHNATYTAYGRRTIAISSEGYVPNGTIMCNAFDSNGRYGVVTNAHVAPANIIMRYENGVDIGKTSISIEDGYMDAAFVPFDNTFFTKWEKTAYVSAIGSNIYTAIARIATNGEYIQGARVVKYGITTGYTVGTIEFANFNTKVGLKSVFNLFKYSNNSIEGDSGGPVVLNTGLPNAGNYLAGIHTYGGEDSITGKNWGAGHRAFRVEERLGVTLLTNTTMP